MCIEVEEVPINHASQVLVVKKLCQHVISNEQANESVQHLGGGPRKAEKTRAEFPRFAG